MTTSTLLPAYVKRGYPIWFYDGQGARFAAKVVSLEETGLELSVAFGPDDVRTIADVQVGGYHDESDRAVVPALNDLPDLDMIEDWTAAQIDGEAE